MIKKINKKGEGDTGLSLAQVLLKTTEIAVGALIIVLALQLIFASVRNAEAQQVSRDMASTLQTMSAYPYTIYYAYPVNLSDGAITFRDESIRVDMARGSYTTPVRLSKGISLEEKYFFNPRNLPIIAYRNKILFSTQNASQILCEQLYKLPSGTNFLIEYNARNEEEQKKLDSLKQGLELIYEIDKDARRNQKITITDRDRANTQTIKISFEEQYASTTLIYNNAKKEHEMFACYTRKKFSEQQFSELSFFSTEFKDSENMEIKLPSIEHLAYYLTNETYQQHREELNTQTETDLMHMYARTIYDLLLKIVKDT